MDLFDDDDLFAVRPAPAPPPIPPRKTRFRRPAPAGFIGPRWPVASLACPCGAIDEVREPCPDRLDCWSCKGLDTMARRVPRYLPPRGAGRELTPHEREAVALDRR